MNFLPFLASGLGLGAIYSMAAVGLVVLYRSTGVLNFSLLGIGAFGAHVAWQMGEWGMPPSVVILAAVVSATLLSLFYGLFLAPRLAARDAVVKAVGTLAFALLLIAAMGLMWGEGARRITLPTDQLYLTLLGTRLTYTRIAAMALCGMMVLSVSLLLKFTPLGLAMRALANDRDLSAILGVKVGRTEAAAWLIAGVLAGLSGLLLADMVRLQGTFLTFLVIPAIAAAILGQLNSLVITALGGIAIGLAEALLTPFPMIAPYRGAAPFLIALAAIAIMGATSRAAVSDR